jgi:hypothetical protein
MTTRSRPVRPAAFPTRLGRLRHLVQDQQFRPRARGSRVGQQTGQFIDASGAISRQNDPKTEPSIRTATSAMMQLTITVITMSR